MTNIAITGAAGRMGQRLIALASANDQFKVVAAIERTNHAALGRDAGEIAGAGPIGLSIGTDLTAQPDVLIDFTSPASMRHWLDICSERGIPMVIGTTGLPTADHTAIDVASSRIAILQAPNMSLGVNVLFKIAAEVARILGDEYDIEIVEGHHRFKKDAPSGTALGLADAILMATDKTRDELVYGRWGDQAPRKPGEIGMHSLRIGDEIGRHTAYFASLGERLELTHVATNRDTFAHGALRAAQWLTHQKPGRYHMASLLGL